MLQEIQNQIFEIKKLHETQHTPTCEIEDKTLLSTAENIDDATKQLEYVLLLFIYLFLYRTQWEFQLDSK